MVLKDLYEVTGFVAETGRIKHMIRAETSDKAKEKFAATHSKRQVLEVRAARIDEKRRNRSHGK